MAFFVLGASSRRAELAGETGGLAYTSTVEIHGSPVFHGHVSSSLHPCFRHRAVQVRRQGGHLIGHTKTNRHGKWKLPRPGLRGRFYARVPAKRVLKGPQRYCLSANSDHFVRIG